MFRNVIANNEVLCRPIAIPMHRNVIYVIFM